MVSWGSGDTVYYVHCPYIVLQYNYEIIEVMICMYPPYPTL